MKLFIYAIASIVDANTGYGLSARKSLVEPQTAVKRAGRFRSNPLHGIAASVMAAAGEQISRLKARVQARRDLKQLMAMSDRLLKDIGLSRGDLVAVELGQTTLAELYAERRRARSASTTTQPTAAACVLEPVGEAANENDYHAQKCA